jgi:hypothetical protein
MIYKKWKIKPKAKLKIKKLKISKNLKITCKNFLMTKWL